MNIPNILIKIDHWFTRYILRREYFIRYDKATKDGDKSVFVRGYIDRKGKTKITDII